MQKFIEKFWILAFHHVKIGVGINFEGEKKNFDSGQVDTTWHWSALKKSCRPWQNCWIRFAVK